MGKLLINHIVILKVIRVLSVSILWGLNMSSLHFSETLGNGSFVVSAYPVIYCDFFKLRWSVHVINNWWYSYNFLIAIFTIFTFHHYSCLSILGDIFRVLPCSHYFKHIAPPETWSKLVTSIVIWMLQKIHGCHRSSNFRSSCKRIDHLGNQTTCLVFGSAITSQ